MAPGRRFLLYAQHLSGAGHFVRLFEIASALAERHEVHLLDGGRPIPRRAPEYPFARLALPRIVRGPAGLAPFEQGLALETVLAARRRALREAVARIRPDVVVVEHFPFSKWELAGEILELLERARAANAACRVACSLRDISPPTRHDPGGDDRSARALRTLRERFDAVLVHADPRLVRLEESVPWSASIPVPIHYTGYVSEKPNRDGRVAANADGSGRLVVASAGGPRDLLFLHQTLAAWKVLGARGFDGGRALAVFLPPSLPAEDVDDLRHAARGERVRVQPFAADFLHWLGRAELSWSRAGYNTCTNLLETRTRAVLVPNPVMSDQRLRAERLAARGLALVVASEALGPEALADATQQALLGPAPAHDIDLEGGARTRAILEEL